MRYSYVKKEYSFESSYNNGGKNLSKYDCIFSLFKLEIIS